MGRRTILLIALFVQIFAWLMVLGHTASLNAGVQQSLFGIIISADASIKLRILEGFAIGLSALAMIMTGERLIMQKLMSTPVVDPTV